MRLATEVHPALLPWQEPDTIPRAADVLHGFKILIHGGVSHEIVCAVDGMWMDSRNRALWGLGQPLAYWCPLLIE